MPPFPPPMMGGAPQAGMPPGGTGTASAPQAMMGAGTQSISKIKLGLQAMQEALPGLPMGSELHTAIMKAITDVSKHIEKSEGDSASIIQQLAQMARSQQQAPQQAALMRAIPPGPASPPPPMAAQAA